MITERDLADPEFTERVSGELRLMADDVDADPATAEDAAAAGRRHRLRTRLLAAGSTIAAIVALVAVFLAVQPLGAPDVATPPGTPAPSSTASPTVPAIDDLVIPPLSESEIDRRFARANDVLARTPASHPVQEAAADGRLTSEELRRAFERARDCALQSNTDLEWDRIGSLSFSRVDESEAVYAPPGTITAEECVAEHFDAFGRVDGILIGMSQAQQQSEHLPDCSDEQGEEGFACIDRRMAIAKTIFEANIAQVGQYERLVPRTATPPPTPGADGTDAAGDTPSGPPGPTWPSLTPDQVTDRVEHANEVLSALPPDAPLRADVADGALSEDEVWAAYDRAVACARDAGHDLEFSFDGSWEATGPEGPIDDCVAAHARDMIELVNLLAGATDHQIDAVAPGCRQDQSPVGPDCADTIARFTRAIMEANLFTVGRQGQLDPEGTLDPSGSPG